MINNYSSQNVNSWLTNPVNIEKPCFKCLWYSRETMVLGSITLYSCEYREKINKISKTIYNRMSCCDRYYEENKAENENVEKIC